MKALIKGFVATAAFGLLSTSVLATEANTTDGYKQAVPVVTMTAVSSEQAAMISALQEARRVERQQLEADYAELIESIVQEQSSSQI